MDEDIDFTEDFRLFPGVDLTLWFTFALAVAMFAAIVGALALVVMWIS